MNKQNQAFSRVTRLQLSALALYAVALCTTQAPLKAFENRSTKYLLTAGIGGTLATAALITRWAKDPKADKNLPRYLWQNLYNLRTTLRNDKLFTTIVGATVAALVIELCHDHHHAENKHSIQNRLRFAIEHHSAEGITESLAAGADITMQPPLSPSLTHNYPPKTLLEYAAAWGSPDELAALIKGGADVNDPNSTLTPLIQAARHGQAASIALLATRGASLEDSVKGRTALLFAAQDGRRKAVETLIKAGAAVTAHDHNHKTVYDYPPAGHTTQTWRLFIDSCVRARTVTP